MFVHAVALLAERGLKPGILADAAARADCDEATARLFFPRDADLVVALHERLANDFEARAADLPEGSVGERFAWANRMRFAMLSPYRAALRSLMAALLDSDGEHGVLSRHTELVRARVGAVFEQVALGATDCPAAGGGALARLLYGMHLALLLLWLQDRNDASDGLLDLVRDVADLGVPMLPQLGQLHARLEAKLAPWLEPAPDPEHDAVARAALRRLFRHRRLLPGQESCASEPCDRCLALHLPRARRFVAAGEPLHFVLPAFPAKSPSPEKTLGARADQAERIALAFLVDVAAEIRSVYPAGARFTICSDGRVFGDLVAVDDAAITQYGEDIDTLIGELETDAIDTFATDDLLDGEHDAMRSFLIAHYAEPLAEVEQRARDYPHHRAMWNGMQRFLFEDRLAFDTGSRTQLRKKCGELAHAVIQRSNAWTRVVAECFPTAMRLSIHPQPAHSDKIGIRLADHEDVWLTPWHATAVERAGGFTLMKRKDAEALGARLVERDGRPSHLVID